MKQSLWKGANLRANNKSPTSLRSGGEKTSFKFYHSWAWFEYSLIFCRAHTTTSNHKSLVRAAAAGGGLWPVHWLAHTSTAQKRRQRTMYTTKFASCGASKKKRCIEIYSERIRMQKEINDRKIFSFFFLSFVCCVVRCVCECATALAFK